MFVEIKYNDKKKIEEYIKLNSLFLSEYYASVLNEDDISMLEIFNNSQTISDEIKEKSYTYYLIEHKNKIAGIVSLEEQNRMLHLSQIYLLKKYREQKLSYKVIEELKQLAKKKGFKELTISILESNKKFSEIVKKWGFKKSDSVARYVGSNIYLYEDEYVIAV